jgi:hypothetical protein
VLDFVLDQRSRGGLFVHKYPRNGCRSRREQSARGNVWDHCSGHQYPRCPMAISLHLQFSGAFTAPTPCAVICRDVWISLPIRAYSVLFCRRRREVVGVVKLPWDTWDTDVQSSDPTHFHVLTVRAYSCSHSVGTCVQTTPPLNAGLTQSLTHVLNTNLNTEYRHRHHHKPSHSHQHKHLTQTLTQTININTSHKHLPQTLTHTIDTNT